MKKLVGAAVGVGEPTARLTRARSAAFQQSGSMPSSEVSKKQDQKQVLRPNSKRAALDERNNNAPVCVQHKRRVVLKDVTNVCCENSYRNCVNATKIPKRNSKQANKVSVHESKVALSVAVKTRQVPTGSTSMGQEAEKTELQSAKVVCSTILEKSVPFLQNTEIFAKECGIYNPQLGKQQSGIPAALQRFSKKAGKAGLCEKQTKSTNPDFIDIDSDHNDPQLCSPYAPDIYSNLHVAELIRRPHSNFMETVQRDITQSMRGILVDWLVEVCEEYRLVQDTLFLTVCLIDLFLSQNYIERQRLQLLGITCMLIASKYEEMCAPHVEEFCFITDNTYEKGEVLEMESQVLNYLGFRLSAPTAKTFLRRFLRAAQASYKSPSLELEFLANYLAELTLLDYSFLKFLPSIIAASAVFLARWTVDQSGHPWNPTMEYYTNYKAADLKTTVLALQGLQLNTSGCPLNAIRTKYRQDKFKCVAASSSPKLHETLF